MVSARTPSTLKDVKKRVFPRDPALVQNVWRDLVHTSIVGDYAPASPPISHQALLACVGSCFARELAESLSHQGKPVAHIEMSERWNTAYAIRHFVDSAMTGTPLPEGFAPPGKELNALSLDQMKSADAFILTFGLSMVWVNDSTGRLVMDVKAGHSGKEIVEALATHTMRHVSVVENVEQMQATIQTIRSVKPQAPIVLTLSPIPLFMAQRPGSSVANNTVSKAALRLAIHEIMESAPPGIYYWPSYEIIEFQSRYRGPIWGQDGDDMRHIKPAAIAEMMRMFSEYYFASPSLPPT